MTTCPTCNKVVDPLRARSVGVRDGKVVAYCSSACAAAAETRPVRVPQPAHDDESGPVIEVLHEPASGVVTSAKDERRPEDSAPVVPPSTTGATAAAAAPTAPVPASTAKSASTSTAKSTPTPTPTAAAPSPPSVAASGAARASRPSGTLRARERRDSTEAKAGWDWIDEEPASSMRAPSSVEQPPRPSRLVPLLLLVAVVGLGGLAAYYFLVLRPRDAASSEAAGPAPVPARDAGFPVADAAPVATTLTPQAAVAQATQLLHTYLADGSPRVQRLAAGVLARTGDAKAVAKLAEAVQQEKVAAARFVVAYQLGRAGDKRGGDALAAGLTLADRSDKLDAAKRLAHLGDKRAAPLLISFLPLEQHRLGAAVELARIGNPAGLKVLQQTRADPRASPDEKATATLALARAGGAALTDEVRTLLADRM
nr:hypothetical protein [Myxococcota bacterium]